MLYQSPFDYICVYDFECQCEEGTKNLTFNVISYKFISVIGNYWIPSCGWCSLIENSWWIPDLC